MNVSTAFSISSAIAAPSTPSATPRVVLAPGDGRRFWSGPGRDLIFKLTGDQTGGAFDYFIVEVAPRGGPPLHVHHSQHETIQVLKGRYKVRIDDDVFALAEGGFAFLPAGLPHAFLNLTDDPGEIIVVFVPGGGHEFFAEMSPLTRAEKPDRTAIAQVFAKHDMTLLGPPLSRE